MPTNPKDPLLKAGPEVERHLFGAFSKIASGHDHVVVVGATMNLMVNAVRQNCATRSEAERAFDELTGRAKNLLLTQHYDAVSGKRRSIFPFEQHVHAQLVHWNEKT